MDRQHRTVILSFCSDRKGTELINNNGIGMYSQSNVINLNPRFEDPVVQITVGPRRSTRICVRKGAKYETIWIHQELIATL